MTGLRERKLAIAADLHWSIEEMRTKETGKQFLLSLAQFLPVYSPALRQVYSDYDTYFTKTFKSLSNNECGFSSFNKKSLEYIYEFYIQNQEDIDKLSKKIKTLDFVEEKKTEIMYPKAKIIDMYGFNSSFK